MDDHTLIQSILQGNRQAFNALVSAYHAPLLSSARHLLRDVDDADDLVQETLVEAYRRLGDLHEAGKFKPWVFTILRHKCLRFLQRRQLATESLEYHASLPAPEAPDGSMRELLRQLPPADQQVLSARYLQGLSYGEIAGYLGITEHTARVRCLRARKRFRQLIEEAEAEMQRVLAYAFRVPRIDQQPTALTRPTTTGERPMEMFVLRYHQESGQQTTYQCEDLLALSGRDYLYVIRYDLVETIERLADGAAIITEDFPHFRIIKPSKEPAMQETDLPVDTSTQIRQTLQRHPNGEVQELQMHYTDGAFIAGMGEMIEAIARGITFPDHPLCIGEPWETKRTAPTSSGDTVWESARHQMTDVDERQGCRYATILTKIDYFMPVAPMWKAPEATETQGYGQTRELHVQTIFNITKGLVEQRSYSGTVINDIWLLEPERRHLRHDIISVTGNAERTMAG